MKEILLGIIQGLTEFLPISSSGHLVIFKHLLNFKSPGVIMEVSFHFGTLIAILIFFRKEIKNYINKDKILMLLVGTIPIALAGIIFKETIESMFNNPLLVFIMLFITGLMLIFSSSGKENKELNWRTAFIIGIAQAFALIPGISRSGFTISTALILGISKQKSFEFSFILAIPALLGAFILQLAGLGNINFNYTGLISGTIASLFSGLLALWILYRIIRNQNLKYFTYYLWSVSLLGILLFLTSQSLF